MQTAQVQDPALWGLLGRSNCVSVGWNPASVPGSLHSWKVLFPGQAAKGKVGLVRLERKREVCHRRSPSQS